MTIIQEIHAWSKELAAWQQNAITRLYANRILSPQDIEDLYALAKTEVGIPDEEQRSPIKLQDAEVAPLANPISIFDTHCARASIVNHGDFAYVPCGLDILEGLVGACNELRTQATQEKSANAPSDAAYAALEQERQEDRRLDAALDAARAERLKKIEKANACFRDGPPAQKLTLLEAKPRKPVTAWPASLGQDVRGASAIMVSTRIWQADVFRKYIRGQGARHPNPRVTVESVTDWLIQRYVIASTELTSVRVAVWDFLSALERVGYLRRRVRQEFEILRDVLCDETEVLSPETKARALETATHGVFWARDVADESQFWSAVRKTGVHVAPSDARMLLSAWQDAKLRLANEAPYAGSVAPMLRIPVEKAVELLAAAGVFVRAVA
ncbi:hypothetical protein [Paraburkholderia hospita]|uniref:hypothetical protein n=1 Tax=Paraburkholderia hospita TaxID=169430 RepID=UPI0009A5F21B|nr:hypothetical protein [Paraburkholderia hospita]SKC69609.1 hypothetical protein SAMN05446934_1970 [Paraburkholderia hospita]